MLKQGHWCSGSWFVFFCTVVWFSLMFSLLQSKFCFTVFRKFGHNYLELFLHVKIRTHACDSLNRKLLLISTRFMSHFISHLNLILLPSHTLVAIFLLLIKYQ